MTVSYAAMTHCIRIVFEKKSVFSNDEIRFESHLLLYKL